MAGRLFGALLDRLNLLSSLGIMLLILLISADVIGRSFFSAPIPGVPEIVRFAVVCMFWMQMAYVLRTGGHLRTTLLFSLFPPLVQRIVLVANALVGGGLMALIVWFGWPELVGSYAIGEFEGAHPVRILVWPIWAIILLGAGLTAVQFAIHLVKVLRGERLPGDDLEDEIEGGQVG